MGALDLVLHDILIYEMKNGEGKGRKYLEKKIIFFLGEKKNGERIRGKYLENRNIFCGGEEQRKRKRRKIFGERKSLTGRKGGAEGKEKYQG